LKDANNLRAYHVQREKRNMQICEKNCKVCHPKGLPKKKEYGKETQEGCSRSEWITFIATLQDLELNKEIQNTINSQIGYHISKY
jgi:hypothetical protein